jgi:hypothetical protein
MLLTAHALATKRDLKVAITTRFSKPLSSAEKKVADFGTSNNVITSAFTFSINRTKKFLVTYCNSSKIIRRFIILSCLLVLQERVLEKVVLVFAQGLILAPFFPAEESGFKRPELQHHYEGRGHKSG